MKLYLTEKRLALIFSKLILKAKANLNIYLEKIKSETRSSIDGKGCLIDQLKANKSLIKRLHEIHVINLNVVMLFF